MWPVFCVAVHRMPFYEVILLTFYKAYGKLQPVPSKKHTRKTPMSEVITTQAAIEKTSNKAIAEKLAHVEEDFNRIGRMKELLGMTPDADAEAAKRQILEATETKLIQSGGSFVGELNVLKNERGEVVSTIEANMRRNLIDYGVTLDERGAVTEDAFVTADVARQSNRIIGQVRHLVERETSSNFDSRRPEEVKLLSINGETSEEDAATQYGATTVAFKALGLNSDYVNSVPFEATDTTSAGWSSETKRIPTDVPGVMYKEVLYQAPDGSSEPPVRHASLELSTLHE